MQKKKSEGGLRVKMKAKEIVFIALDEIKEPSIVARVDLGKDGVDDLAASIREIGQINPIQVKRVKGGFEVVAGHRRLLACRQLGKVTIAAEIVRGREAYLEAIKYAENAARQQLSKFDVAAYAEALRRKPGASNRSVARIMGVSEQHVGQLLAIRDWPECLQEAMRDESISFSAARELAKISDPGALENYVRFARESGCTPRLALQWRSEWEAAQNWNQPGEGEKVNEQWEAQRSLGECFMCAQPADWSALVPVWMHGDCRQDLVEAMRQMRAEDAGNESDGEK